MADLEAVSLRKWLPLENYIGIKAFDLCRQSLLYLETVYRFANHLVGPVGPDSQL